MKRAVDYWHLLALQNPSALEYCFDQTKGHELKMTPSVQKAVSKFCSLFNFKMVLEQHCFFHFWTWLWRSSEHLFLYVHDFCICVMPCLQTCPEVWCSLEYFVALSQLLSFLCFARTLTAEEGAINRHTKATTHGVVQKRVHGRVGVDEGLGEEHVPNVQPGLPGQGIVDEEPAKRQPCHGEEDHNDD